MTEDKKSVLESITIEDEEEDIKNEQNTLQDTILAIDRSIFKNFPRKKSNLSRNNEVGLIQAEVLNEYMERNFQYRYAVLDTLIECGRDYPISRNGFGIEKFIEAIKSIQATFEQTQLPSRIREMMR